MAAAPLGILLLPLLRAGSEARAALGPALFLVGAAVVTAFGVAVSAALLVPALGRGSRRAVMPAMVVGAAVGVAAVLVVPAATSLVSQRGRVPVPDALLEYVAAAATALGLGLILAFHRLARVGGDGVALVATAALAVGTIEALLPASPTLDDGVVGLMAAAAVLLVGLGSATVAGGPPRVRPWSPPLGGAGGTAPTQDVDPEGSRPFGEAGAAAPTPVAAAREAGVSEAAFPGVAREQQRVAGEAVSDQVLRGLVLLSIVLGVLARVALGSSGGAASDETLGRLAGGSFHDAVAGTAGTAHPPLAVTLAWCSQRLFGAAALRWPAFLAGVLLVPAAYSTGRALYGSRTGMVAAAVAAVGPAFVWASASAGPTTVTALMVCVALLALTRGLRERCIAPWWLLFGLSCAAVVWAHQFGLWTVFVLHGAAGLTVVSAYRTGRSDRTFPDDRPSKGSKAAMTGWVGALALTIAAVALLIGWQHGFGAASTPPTLEYATNAAPSGGHTPFGLAAGALSTIVGFHPPDVTSRLLALWPLGILGAFALFGRRWSPKGVLLVGLAAVPFVALLVADVAGAPRQPPLALEWLAPALPAVALAIGRAVDRLTAAQGRTTLALAAVVAVLALATADQSVRVAGRPEATTATATATATAAEPHPPPTTTTRR